MRTLSITLFSAVAASIIISNAPAYGKTSNVYVHVIAPSLSAIPMFDTEPAARHSCRGGDVVWLNTDSRNFHPRGDAWYGKTKHGAYVCRDSAVARHYRETGNVKVSISR